jgi:hypothetical protein
MSILRTCDARERRTVDALCRDPVDRRRCVVTDAGAVRVRSRFAFATAGARETHRNEQERKHSCVVRVRGAGQKGAHEAWRFIAATVHRFFDVARRVHRRTAVDIPGNLARAISSRCVRMVTQTAR